MECGFFDSEVAYAVANATDDFSKQLLFAGGVASFAGIDPSKPLEEFVKNAKTNPQVKEGYNMMLESIIKDVASLLPSVKPKEIILSGRFTRIPEFLAALKSELSDFFATNWLESRHIGASEQSKGTKQAAEGAAVFANGLAGGKYKQLIDAMRLQGKRRISFQQPLPRQRNR